MKTQKNFQSFLFIFAVLAFCFATQALQAYSEIPSELSKDEITANLVKQSDLIVRGVVAGKTARYGERPEWMPARHPMILTDVAVTVNEVIKASGPAKRRITVTIPGGCITEDDLCMKTDVVPEFEEGEQVVLFLKSLNAGQWRLTDFIDGKQVVNAKGEIGLGKKVTELRKLADVKGNQK